MTHADEKLTLEKLQLRIDEICNTVIEQAQSVDPKQTSELQVILNIGPSMRYYTKTTSF